MANQVLDKGLVIIHTLSIKALDNSKKGGCYSVHLTKGSMINDGFGGVVLSIEDTPGSWYLKTLCCSGKSDSISIHGDWICTNFGDIMDELETIIQQYSDLN